ncbi:MAG TPA: dihydrofolate reductase family protein [Candidatus Limnocylindrales bacterium]|nr:dihydrofolate reductase family protein [Candidatus Limnocylindrales bacterium]
MSPSTPADLPRLDVMYDDVADDVAAAALPPALAAAYGGGLGLGRSVVYANMVSTLDGVAADRSRERSSRDISAGDPGDRFVMGLLRSHADAIVIGAGTLRAHPGTSWTAEAAFAGAADYAEVAVNRGSPSRPQLVVLTTTGDLPPHPALPGSIVVTSERGADRLRDDVSADADVRVVGTDGHRLDVTSALASVRSDGHRSILTEGGPRLLGGLVGTGSVDELFVTVSPLIAGRSSADRRPGLVDGVAFRPGAFPSVTLRSIRRHGSALFLRYRTASGFDASTRSRKKGSM